MRLENEFEVAVDVDRVWETLLDIERVAGFLPGAVIEPAGEDGVYHGSMRIKLGPVVANYQGSARLGRVDASERSAHIEIEARDARGQGSVSGVIHNRLVPTERGTRVVAVTDLDITGRQAQFGRGIMEDVAGRMLQQFAQRFERFLREPAGTPPDGGEEPPELDLLSTLPGMRAVRVGGVAAVVLLGVVAWRRRRRSLVIRISHSW